MLTSEDTIKNKFAAIFISTSGKENLLRYVPKFLYALIEFVSGKIFQARMIYTLPCLISMHLRLHFPLIAVLAIWQSMNLVISLPLPALNQNIFRKN